MSLWFKHENMQGNTKKGEAVEEVTKDLIEKKWQSSCETRQKAAKIDRIYAGRSPYAKIGK